MDRKLCTILAMDVVGFSKMMSNDEVKTLEILKNRRSVIDTLIEEYNGKIFNTAGDSVFAEFLSPVKAAECAIQIHSKNQTLNNEDVNMSFRIGINIGDVMISENNLFGDTVNIAARLEATASTNGICISKNVFDMINMKMKISYEDAGEIELKNIGRPIHCYHIIECKGTTRWFQHDEDKPEIKIEKPEAGSLAVMLFKSLSSDEEQAYFCEGFSEDLISSFSRYKKLVVISSNASFSYRDKNKKPSEIGKELGVRYILEGKVRKLGSKIRITCSLTSTENENTLWSNNFDTNIDEIFDIQDELVEKIVTNIIGNVEKDHLKLISNSKPENMEAYDLVLKGLEYHRKSSVCAENNKKALEYFTKATEVDPKFARAHSWKGCSLANNAEWFPDEMPKNWLDEAFSSVKKALELDADDPESHRIMGAVKLLFENDLDTALFHHKKAIDICPSDTYHISRYTILLCYMGEFENALEEIKKAMRIDPFCTDLIHEAAGLCYYGLKMYEEAILEFKKIKVDTRNSLFYLAASFNKLKNKEKSNEYLNKATQNGKISINKFLSSQPFKDSIFIKDLETNLNNI